MTHRVFAGIAPALALSAGIAAASEYSDFRIPSHSWSRLDLGIFGIYSPSLATTDNGQDRNTYGSGQLSGSWLHGHDSDRLQHLIQLSAAGSLNSQTSEIDRTDSFNTFRDHIEAERQEANEYWLLAGELRHYPLSIPLGFMGRVIGQGGYVQSWVSEQRFGQNLSDNVAQTNEASTETWRYTYDVFATAGLPWGRVRDVTGVQRVQYAEDRLARDRVLTGPLAPATRRRLAELFYTQSKFSFVHDLPDRHFWAEFERILREDPAVRADRIDAYSIFHAADPLVVSRGYGRRAGYSAGPVITFVHENDVIRADYSTRFRYYQGDTLTSQSQYSSGQRRELDDQRARAGAEAQIEQPLGLRWQVSAFGNATSDLRGLDHDLQVHSSLSVRYWEGERWYWDTGASQDRRTGSEVPNSVLAWAVSYGSSLSFFLEDHVSLDLSVRGTQGRLKRGDYTRVSEVRIGLSYRSGSLTAPGLFAPVRPGS